MILRARYAETRREVGSVDVFFIECNIDWPRSALDNISYRETEDSRCQYD